MTKKSKDKKLKCSFRPRSKQQREKRESVNQDLLNIDRETIFREIEILMNEKAHLIIDPEDSLGAEEILSRTTGIKTGEETIDSIIEIVVEDE